MSDADVIREVLAGRHELFAELVERHFVAVYGLCLSHVKDPTEAEDAAQETFVRCYKRLDTLKNPRGIRAWLSTIARNVCLDRLRANTRRREAMAELARNGEDHEAPVDAERAERAKAVRAMVDDLPQKTREAIYLHYFEGKSLKEIGEYLGKSPNAVAGLLKYGRKILKDKLWSEAADSIRSMRPKKDTIVRACAAIPLGEATWTTKGGVDTAVGAGHLIGLGGLLIMNVKLLVSALAAILILVIALLLWTPWHKDARTSKSGALTVAKPELTTVELVESSAEPASAASAFPDPVTATIPEEKKDKPLPEEQADEVLPASVLGTVTNQEGYPIEGATVELHAGVDAYREGGHEVYRAQTTADGTYEIAGIATFGEAVVYVIANGYHMPWPFCSEEWTLSPGQERTNLDLVLQKASFFISGKVLTAQRRPIPGAVVGLIRVARAESGSMNTGGGRTLMFAATDGHGHFEIPIPTDGVEADFRVTKKGYGAGYFPGIPVGADDVVLVMDLAGAISGTVKWSDGELASGVKVEAVGKAFPDRDPYCIRRIRATCRSVATRVVQLCLFFLPDGLAAVKSFVFRFRMDSPFRATV